VSHAIFSENKRGLSRRPDAGSARQAASPAVPSRTTAKLVWARPSASVLRCARSVTVAGRWRAQPLAGKTP